MHIEQLWRYPVKSMIGERVTTVEVASDGIVGDRTWAVRDEVRGGIRGAKKIGALMQFGARYSGALGGHVDITMPDGSTANTADDDVHRTVSGALGHTVTLWPLQPASDLDHYRRGAADSDDVMAELMSIFGREAGEPLPDFSIFPPEVVEFESPPGTYLDAFPLMIMSTSALRSMEAALPDSVIDIHRFRPSIVVDTGDRPGHPEFEWVGRNLRVGTIDVEIVAACPRCVMVTREISTTLPSDRAILRHIVRDLDQNVGVYGRSSTPGTINVGDAVEVL